LVSHDSLSHLFFTGVLGSAREDTRPAPKPGTLEALPEASCEFDASGELGALPTITGSGFQDELEDSSSPDLFGSTPDVEAPAVPPSVPEAMACQPEVWC
jgi:hypothetical protein